MKRNQLVVLIGFLFMLCSFSFAEKAIAAAGDFTSPYSAWDYNSIGVKEFKNDVPRVIDFQQIGLITGDEANAIVQYEYEYNTKPEPDQQWILMGFRVKYLYGEEEAPLIHNLLNPEHFYKLDGKPMYNGGNKAVFTKELAKYSEYDNDRMEMRTLSPGESGIVWYGLLADKTDGLPLIRLGYGWEDAEMNSHSLYKWYSTEPSHVEAAESVKASPASFNSVKLSWAAAKNVTGYDVYRSTSPGGPFTKIKSVTGTSFTDTNLNTGTTYYYQVQTYKTNGDRTDYGKFSPTVSAKPVLSGVTSAKAASSGYTSIKTSWGKVSGASGYEVHRSTSKTGTFTVAGQTTTATSFTNTSLTTNKVYYYKVRAYRNVGKSKVYGPYSTIVSAKPIPAAPATFTASRYSSTSVKTTWSKVSGASGYQVYRATSPTGTYSLVKSTTSLSSINTGLVKGRTYYYKVRAYTTVGNVKVYSGWTKIIGVKTY